MGICYPPFWKEANIVIFQNLLNLTGITSKNTWKGTKSLITLTLKRLGVQFDTPVVFRNMYLLKRG